MAQKVGGHSEPYMQGLPVPITMGGDYHLVQTLGRGPTVGSTWSSYASSSLGRNQVAPPPLVKLEGVQSDWQLR